MPTRGWTRAIVLIAAAVWAALALLHGSSIDGAWFSYAGTSASAVVYLMWAFDRWLWHLPGVRGLHGRPVLHGTWRCVLETNYEARRGEEIECYLVVRQTYSHESVAMLLEDSSSASTAAALDDRDGRLVLSYVFLSEKRLLARAGNPPARGACELTIGREPTLHLEGDYWMEHGTGGHVVTRGHDRKIYDTFAGARKGDYPGQG